MTDIRCTVRPIIRLMLLVAGISLAAMGLFWGEAWQIMKKAVIVCLECIGIG